MHKYTILSNVQAVLYFRSGTCLKFAWAVTGLTIDSCAALGRLAAQCLSVKSHLHISSFLLVGLQWTCTCTCLTYLPSHLLTNVLLFLKHHHRQVNKSLQREERQENNKTYITLLPIHRAHPVHQLGPKAHAYKVHSTKTSRCRQASQKPTKRPPRRLAL